SEIRASDTFLVAGAATSSVQFYLHAGLTIESISAAGRSLTWKEESHDDADWEHAVRYRTALPSTTDEAVEILIKYAGSIVDSVADGTTGTIEKQGAFLSNETAWVPTIPSSRYTFSLIAITPQSWEVLTQGRLEARSDGGGRKTTRYASEVPMDEIYLIAGPYRFYEADHRGIRIVGLLYQADDATELWETYRAAAIRYLDLYGGQIGRYPYPKFAFAENFWETGYGMPSFTLLGSKVLRLPFIPGTSFRHEVLHNWWGNGVFLDPDQGNWCEALTNFMADFAKAEEEGEAAARRHRLRELQRFWNEQPENRAVSLVEFEQGTDPDQTAIGYTKGAFFFHMLREHVGPVPFARSMRHFYAEYRGREAGWEELRKVVADDSGTNLDRFFDEWVDRKGAPRLELAGVSRTRDDDEHVTAVTIRQHDPFFDLDVPIEIETGDGARHEAFVILVRGEGTLEWRSESPVVRVTMDPDYDLFRRLEDAEMPPSVSTAFSGRRFGVVLPDTSAVWRDAVAQWKPKGGVSVRGQDETQDETQDGEEPDGVTIDLWDGPEAWAASHPIPLPIARNDSSWVVSGEEIGDGTFFYVTDSGEPGGMRAALVVRPGDDIVDIARRIPYYSYYGTLLFRDGEVVFEGEWDAIPPEWRAPE
ncbi:MAG: hypothetical protein HKN20_09295, partial [Gemmatimonadetes bacterium]|nr:hypothetical protein [Gemmatimonadota bacterium]